MVVQLITLSLLTLIGLSWAVTIALGGLYNNEKKLWLSFARLRRCEGSVNKKLTLGSLQLEAFRLSSIYQKLRSSSLYLKIKVVIYCTPKSN